MVALLVAGYALTVGLRSMSQPTLSLPDRKLIGRCAGVNGVSGTDVNGAGGAGVNPTSALEA